MKTSPPSEQLISALQLLDDELLEQALATDDKEKLHRIKEQEKNTVIGLHPLVFRLITASLCTILIVALIFATIPQPLSYVPIASNNSQTDTAINSNSLTPESSIPGTPAPDTSDTQSTPNQSDHSLSTSSSQPITSDEPVASDNTGSGADTQMSAFTIDSMDKLNFYSAKKIIEDYGLLPLASNRRPTAYTLGAEDGTVLPLSGNLITHYEIDRYTKFTINMVTYFTIELLDENGFLANKLGGTGPVEVVVTDNDWMEMNDMITFKREDRYYTCMIGGGSYDHEAGQSSQEFITSKYISGFQIVKNYSQENYKFHVFYDGSKVTGFSCEDFKNDGITTAYVPDTVHFIEDFCIVLYTKQTVTIDQLEAYFAKEER